ncbi:hypothetical protein DXG03_000535 [Asterophora parasitica]|uniref:Fungal-type protein kinase domain-containing protein n=1 Tax=Asterophora parasitica TaxID=117018 RepID=A0A9P7G6F2_9AGAR|nr:hypothetical protein DXG03_000535 [Asterophora parasitica]
MHAVDAKEAVESKLHLLRTVPTEEFLDKNFPSTSLPPKRSIKDLYDELLAAGHFPEDAGWKGWLQPSTKRKRRRLYRSFVNAANEICRLIPLDHGTPMYWIDRRRRSPLSTDPNFVNLRPNCLSASILDEMELEDLDTAVKDLASKTTRALSKEAKNLLTIWWGDVFGPVELKWEMLDLHNLLDPASRDVVVQVLAYMRQILEEQPDRRFVFGQGSLTPISINEDPRTFIRVIAGLRCMSPDKLGWDPGMMVYKPLKGRESPSPWIENTHYQLVPSYACGEELRKHTSYQRRWVFSVDIDGEPKPYLTVRVISALGSSDMCGRATLVFEVIDLSDPEPKETFALKRYWRPFTEDAPSDLVDPENQTPLLDAFDNPIDTLHPPEGQIYDLLARGHIIAHHDLQINGHIDDTFSLIRGGVESESLPTSRPVQPDDIRKEYHLDAENQHHIALPSTTTGMGTAAHWYTEQPHLDLQRQPVGRIHTQILMPVGYSIEHFCDLDELMWAFIGCCDDYLALHRLWFVHRDISQGNVMIFPNPEAGKDGTIGRLMDYDHAKRAPRANPSSQFPVPSNVEHARTAYHYRLHAVKHILKSNVVHDVRRLTDKDLRHLRLTDEVLLECLRRAGGNEEYLSRVIAHRLRDFDLSLGDPLTLADLGWDDLGLELPWPDFGKRAVERTVRNCASFPCGQVVNFGEKGTDPYISADVLNGRWTFPPTICRNDLDSSFSHNAVHDMESLLWVLTYLCLTRKGPGMNMLRDELHVGQKGYPPLRRVIIKYFDAPRELLKDSKPQLLLRPELLDDEILPLFHPYFDPLKPLVRQWLSTLILAHCYRGHEWYYIIQHIRRLLRMTRENLPRPAECDMVATARELKRRDDELKWLLESIGDAANPEWKQVQPILKSEATHPEREQPQASPEGLQLHRLAIIPDVDDDDDDVRSDSPTGRFSSQPARPLTDRLASNRAPRRSARRKVKK